MAKMKIHTGARIPEPGNSVKNKTGTWRSLRPVRDPKLCRRCGICWQFCPEGCISPKTFDSDPDYCKGCGICAKECPFKAIRMVKEEK